MGEDEKLNDHEVITAVYKLNLHCQQCVRAIEKNLLRTEGVRKVEADDEFEKLIVKGKIDVVKILEQIERKSRRKVELVSPLPKKVEPKVVVKKVEKKEITVKTTVLKLDLHCENCEDKLKKKLLELEGVHIVNTNREKQTITIEGTTEPENLIKFFQKKFHKQAELVSHKEHKENKGMEEEKKEEQKKVKETMSEVVTLEKMERKEEARSVQHIPVPYVIHYAYPPQMFSDENPNACVIT